MVAAVTAGVAFRKGHGTGNDFVLLPDAAFDPSAEQVRRLTHRRHGIGGDGILRVVRTVDATEPEVQAQADRATWFMDYRNADGSLAQMCGNGARLFARHLVDSGLEEAGDFVIATRGGARAVRVPESGDVEVEMGRAAFSRSDVVPQVRVGDQTWPTVAVFLPNPHAVTFVEDLAEAGPLIDAPLVEPPEAFPDGVNVEFVVTKGAMYVAMRVHERGVGETQSCGTGAAAVMFAAAIRDAAPTEVTYAVDVPGGRVWVRRDRDSVLTLIGPVEFVAEGTIAESLLAD
jgi:diaminopimelate epimerase